MSFVTPLFLLALIVVPATAIFLIVMNHRRARNAIAFTNLDVLASVAEHQRSWKRWVPVALILLALACSATALARPRVHLTVPEENATVILLVDVSGSMRANDVEPSRLDAAVDAMRQFLVNVPKQVKVGLVAFSSSAEVLAQPTTDRESVNDGLGFLAPEAGTALGDGIVLATKVAVSSLAKQGIHKDEGKFLPAAIVLESDGAQNRGTASPIQSAELAKKAGVRVYGVALGTPNGKVQFGFGLFTNSIPVPPDPATVRAVSRITGGKSFNARDATRLTTVYKDLGSSVGRKRELREITQWFAIGAAILLVSGVALARAWSSPLP
jgi:Ca-activated chloride channel family protein